MPSSVIDASAPENATPELLGFATCPLCHTTAATITNDGADWQCARCGQKWSATRRAGVLAYAAWVAEQQQAAPRRRPEIR